MVAAADALPRGARCNVCRIRAAVAACADGRPLCRGCHASQRVSFACPCMRLEEAQVIVAELEAARALATPNAVPKAAPAPPVEAPPAMMPCPCCGQPMRETDWRPEPPRWVELMHIIDGARARGWAEAQLDYFRAALGLAWAKAFKRGQLAGPPKED